MNAAPSRREPLLDALRALAMFGVIAVNAVSYAEAPWGPVLGTPWPEGAWPPLVVHGLIAGLLHGKAYPLLAFLFGASLVLAAGRGIDATHQGRQLRRLLALGVLHGALIYFGDILTMYALCGLMLHRQVHAEPLHRLRQRWRRACVWAIAALLLQAWLAVSGAAAPGWEPDLVAFAQVTGWQEQLRLNLSSYGVLQAFALVLFLPLLRVAMLAGMLAARLRLLTHRRWRPLLARWAWVALPAGLALNAIYAAGFTSATARDDPVAEAAWQAFGPWVGWLLSAGLVCAAAPHARAVARWLAPLGRRTLSLYVAHSLLCMTLFSGAGFGLGLRWGTVGWLVWSAALWAAALLWARLWEARGWRGPLESWMARA